MKLSELIQKLERIKINNGDYDTIMCIYEGSCLCCSISLKRCSKINQILE